MYFAPVARFRGRSFIRIAESYAKAELISLAEAQSLQARLAYLIVSKESYRAAEADGTYT